MAEPTHSLANQMKMRDREMVPRVLVVAMFGLMAASLAIVAFARLTDQPLRGVPAASPVVQEKAITLTGARRAPVIATDESGAEIGASNRDSAGFIDVIWNSIARERMLNRVDGNPPLRLVRRANGHVAILDPATDWSIELIGYGDNNVAAFARLLD
ncbi:MAG: photosynthetic complex assembly protein PuhC [Pseudomonadota bacterium]